MFLKLYFNTNYIMEKYINQLLDEIDALRKKELKRIENILQNGLAICFCCSFRSTVLSCCTKVY